MGWRWLVALFVLFLSATARAPESGAQELWLPRLRPASCPQLFCPSPAAPPPAALFAAPPSSRAEKEIDLNALQRWHAHFHERFHTEHNPRAYAAIAWGATGFYWERLYFSEWKGGTHGFQALRLGSGRLTVGFETHRLHYFEGERNPPLLRDPALCSLPDYASSGVCGLIPFNAGERAYAVGLRWRFGRR